MRYNRIRTVEEPSAAPENDLESAVIIWMKAEKLNACTLGSGAASSSEINDKGRSEQ